MKYFLLLVVLLGCNPANRSLPKVDECVIGPQMDVMKLLREEDEKFLFVEYPYAEDSPVEIMEDVSALKKVECPE